MNLIINININIWSTYNDAFEVHLFQGFIVTPYQRHWYHVGSCSSDLFKVETMLKNAFKISNLGIFSNMRKIIPMKVCRVYSVCMALWCDKCLSRLSIQILLFSFTGIQNKSKIAISQFPAMNNITCIFGCLTEWFIHRLLALNEQDGAQTTIYCATEESVTDLSGGYFSNCGLAKESKLAKDANLAKQMWDVCCEATGFDPDTMLAKK